MTETKPARILIVDDEAALMNALCDTLQDKGYETVGFNTGSAALEALKETAFDLLITDLMMPGMDGIALLKAGLAMDANLVGIIMTGQGTIDTAVEAMKTGALDYILKPFKLSAVPPVISRALLVRNLRVENAVLQQHLQERTIHLEAANKELEAFSYSVSHDLRTPLRAIDGFSHMLLEDYADRLDEQGQKYLNSICAAGTRMAQLIEDMLKLSQVTRGELNTEKVDLSNLATGICEDLQRTRSDRKVTFKIAPKLVARGDRRLLCVVLENLLGNAWKFTSKKPEAVIEFGAVVQQNGNAAFFIRDNGAAFDTAYAGKLFGAFQRLHRTTEFEGTGIGLATVQRVINRHGGRNECSRWKS
jgi:two-component system sensor histidine kinase/response regulator